VIDYTDSEAIHAARPNRTEAHHSHGNYNAQYTILQGTVKDVQCGSRPFGKKRLKGPAPHSHATEISPTSGTQWPAARFC